MLKNKIISLACLAILLVGCQSVPKTIVTTCTKESESLLGKVNLTINITKDQNENLLSQENDSVINLINKDAGSQIIGILADTKTKLTDLKGITYTFDVNLEKAHDNLVIEFDKIDPQVLVDQGYYSSVEAITELTAEKLIQNLQNADYKCETK